MDNTQLFVIATVAVVLLTVGGGVTMAVVFYLFNYMVTGGAVAGIPAEAAPNIGAMALAAWKKERDETRARGARISSAYRSGVMVLIWLGMLTVLEFMANQMGVSTVAMFIIALVKAGIILQFFMHVSSLWLEGGSH